MTLLKLIHTRLRNHSLLLIGLLLIAPVFFFQAFRQPFPLGYAGMFTQMAEQIAEANFALPTDTPHYGPGGIPFVYPPLAMYIFAFAIKLGISTWAYLRFIPAVFSILALIPLYFLTLELIGSKTAALVGLILTASAPSVYYTHVWSAGVVRGLALVLCFAGLLFYLRALRQPGWRDFLFAGLCLGLLLTTHLLYTAFAALMGIIFLLSEWKSKRAAISLGILLLALLTTSPWLGLVISRHGLESLLAASSSHRNTDFFALLFRDTGAALGFLADHLAFIAGNWFLAVLALPGFILLLLQKKVQLPLAFLITLVMGEASIFLPIPTALMAGYFAAWVLEKFNSREKTSWALPSIGFALLSILVLAAILASAVGNISEIARFEPEIDVYSIKMAQFVREETDPQLTYLYIGKINEAEWFPYLLERTPVFALWGSEWKGIYAEQLQILINLRNCQDQKEWNCIQELLTQNKTNPDLLIGPNSRWLNVQIKETRNWNLIYSDERYLVWEKKK